MQFNLLNLIFVVLIFFIGILLVINKKQSEALGAVEKDQEECKKKLLNAQIESSRLEDLYRTVLHHNNELIDENKHLKDTVWKFEHKDDPIYINETELEDDELCWPD